MGIYLNPGNTNFKEIKTSKYVDKSDLIACMNETINTEKRLTMISRPRRFGKSYAAKMLSAYYDRSCDSTDLFGDLKIADDLTYKEHLNKYNVIYLDISSFLTPEIGYEGFVSAIANNVKFELSAIYSFINEKQSLAECLMQIVNESEGNRFVAIIDEWDAPLRDTDCDEKYRKRYLNFLRSLFKSNITNTVFAAAYMTGILPIKKDGSQSAISEFEEYTMLDAGQFTPFIGFTEKEVLEKCSEADMVFGMMQQWYDGYHMSYYDVKERKDKYCTLYNPNSVIKALDHHKFKSYWQQSSAANSLLEYIEMDFEGLAEDVMNLIAGKLVSVEVEDFKNEMQQLDSKDDVLTLLIHFGYLSYDSASQTATIPNEEIRQEFSRNIRKVKNSKTQQRVRESIHFIQDVIAGNENAVAKEIQKIHSEETAPIFYNREEDLRSVVKFAFLAYKDYYLKFEEMPSGDGVADLIFYPKKRSPYPAIIIELKMGGTPEDAIQQIYDKDYMRTIQDDEDIPILLVGISYDKNTREHFCKIEQHMPAM